MLKSYDRSELPTPRADELATRRADELATRRADERATRRPDELIARHSKKVARADHITGLARRRLQASAYSELRDVRCSLQHGTLVLDGTVSSFYLKQLAQTALRELVERLPQVERIENRLQVPA